MKSIILTAQDVRDFEKRKILTIEKNAKPEPPKETVSFRDTPDGEMSQPLTAEGEPCGIPITKPYLVGNVVYIREPWKRIGEKSAVFHYAADAVSGPDTVNHFNWSSPVSMPADAARHYGRIAKITPVYGTADGGRWEITIEKISKNEAESIESGIPFSDAEDEADVSDPVVYKGDMTAEDYSKIYELNQSSGMPETLVLEEKTVPEEPEPPEEIRYGTCPFCGQLVNVGGRYFAQSTADAAAGQICKCPDASRERRIIKNIQDGCDRIQQLFGENAPALGFKPIDIIEPVNLLKDAVSLVARHHISGLAISIRGYCKAKIGLTSKDKIKVERSEAHSCQLEAGE